jgi:hypothetical protein
MMMIEVLIWAVRIFCCLVVILVTGMAVAGARAFLRSVPQGRHRTPAPPAALPQARGMPVYDTGSMTWPEEKAYLVRRDGVVHIRPDGEVDVAPWEVPHGAESGAIWPHQGLWNGHTFGCTIPDEDHPGTCPEEGDDPDDPYGWPVPGLPPAEPPAVCEGPSVVDTAPALGADDPGDAGWTDQLLADLREAPTVLDHPVSFSVAPEPSRLADTGEIAIIVQRADYAAELRAQDDDAAEFSSRLCFDVAAYRLSASKR